MLNLKVKLRCTGSKASRDSVLQVLCDQGVKCAKLVAVDKTLILLYCTTLNDLDKVFSPNCISLLRDIDCDPRVPPDLQAKRSIIIRRVDQTIHNQSSSSIKTELERLNDWLVVDSIYKFPKSRTLKVSFTCQEMVNLSLVHGLIMFHLHIPTTDISREEFTDLMMCFRCYQWESHPTEACPKPKSHVICSLCSATDHSFKNCTADFKKCINCMGSHPTMSFSCPKRKECAKKKREKSMSLQSSEGHRSVLPANDTCTSSPVDKVSVPALGDSNAVTKSAMCIVFAALKKYDSADEFKKTLHHLLTLNNLPLIDTGDLKPPIIDLSSSMLSPGSSAVFAESHGLTTENSSNTSPASILTKPTPHTKVNNKYKGQDESSELPSLSSSKIGAHGNSVSVGSVGDSFGVGARDGLVNEKGGSTGVSSDVGSRKNSVSAKSGSIGDSRGADSPVTIGINKFSKGNHTDSSGETSRKLRYSRKEIK